MNKLVLTAVFALATAISYAQPTAPPTGGPGPGQATDVPLDGGSSLLLASGVAYGLRHLKQRRDQRQAK